MKNYIALIYFVVHSVTSVAQAPSAAFSSNITEGCSPLIVSFSDQSTGNPTSWAWDFGNGATSTLKNPSTTYFNSGTYTVTLTVTNANGSHTITKSSFVTVYNQPIAEFSSTTTTGCTPVNIQFYDQSILPAGVSITSWHWTFGDGGTSSVKDPIYNYRTPGSYTVSLTIQTNKGCAKTITKPYYINPSPGVVPSFSFSDPGVCSAPATVTFTNTSSGPGNLTYFWKLGNNTTSTSTHTSTTYNVNGNYNVTLVVTSDMGCTDSVTNTVVVGKANTNFIIPASICPKRPVQFINDSEPRPISAKWEFSNGTTDTLKNGVTIFQTAGTYTVTLINTYTACIDTLTKTITTSALPAIQFSVSDSVKCQPPLTVNFNNSSNASTYKWDFGDSTSSTVPNPSHTYTRNGTFDVTLIATGSNGCSDTLKKKEYIKIKKPTIAFPSLPVGGCLPLTVNFSANISSVDAVTSYNWNFGNGSTSTSANPNYTYTQQGSYTVSLTITTSTGCTETYSLTDAVKAGTKPTAAFTSDLTTACAQPGIQFTNQSTNATDYLWEFSDGSKSTLKDPKQTFLDTGWVDVKLTAFNFGCPDSVIKRRFAYIKPSISRFDYVPNCSNSLKYTFTNKSIGASTSLWDFGDGTTFSGVNPPEHSFPSTGSYTVTLTTTNNGCTNIFTRIITAQDLTPDFTASSQSGCKPFATTFYPSSPQAGAVKEYVWNFGEGAVETYNHGYYAQHTYLQPGKYTITLTTVDTFGCTYTRSKNDFITVGGPTAKFTSTTNAGCEGLVTTFIDSTRASNGMSIVSWRFDFGDGASNTFTSPPFQHTYDSVGDYDVKLVVTDAGGCADSITYREFVKISKVKAAWSTTGSICPNSGLHFQNNSVHDLPISSTWFFGDGTTSTESSPYHAYTDTGRYTVTLKIKDLVGCEDSLKIINAVHVSVPKADFSANNFVSYCTPFEAKFFNKSSFYVSSIWDLDTDSSTDTNPINYYTQTGIYPIKLLVFGPGNCKDSITKTLEIYNPYDGTINYDDTVGCYPATINFNAFKPMDAQFIWDFGDGTVIDTNSSSIQHVYRNIGNFTPKVILKQPDGCVVPLTGANTIAIYGSKVAFEIDKYFFCDSGRILIKDTTISNGEILSYTWNFGDGVLVNGRETSHNYQMPGNYNISLTVQTEGGCIDSMRLPNPVRVIQSPDISVLGDSIICVSERMQLAGIFNKTDTSLVKWTWQFPNGNSSNAQNPAAQKYTPGTYSVFTRAVNSSGCFDTVVTPITIHSLPVITMPATITKRVTSGVQLPASYSSGITKYLWTPPNNLSCTDCPQPISTTRFSTDYRVSVIDSNGCVDSAAIRVIALCEGATIFFPNAFSPNGDGSNDVFYPRGSGLDRVKSIRLFNRWGEVVFEQKDFPVNNASYGWDGKYKGKPPQPGVYIFQAEIFCENGEVIRIEGNVALIQ